MYISGIKHNVEWVDSLLRKLAPDGWTCDLYMPKRGKPRTGVYGHANWDTKMIEICVSALEPTSENMWVVLHEIAHAIHAASSTFVRPEVVRGRYRRGSLHPREFWDIAIVLYESYDVMDFAVKREYKVGIKRIKAHRTYAWQMKQAEALVESMAA